MLLDFLFGGKKHKANTVEDEINRYAKQFKRRRMLRSVLPKLTPAKRRRKRLTRKKA